MCKTKVYTVFRDLSTLFCEDFNMGPKKKILLGWSLWGNVLFLFNEISGRGVKVLIIKVNLL